MAHIAECFLNLMTSDHGFACIATIHLVHSVSTHLVLFLGLVFTFASLSSSSTQQLRDPDANTPQLKAPMISTSFKEQALDYVKASHLLLISALHFPLLYSSELFRETILCMRLCLCVNILITFTQLRRLANQNMQVGQ